MQRNFPNESRLATVRDQPDLAYSLPAFTPNEPEQVLSFGHYWWLLRRHWWQISLVVALGTAAAGAVAFRLTPMYESTARIAINLKSPSTVMSDVASPSGGPETDQIFNTEIQLMQSDAVLRPVAQQFHLTPTASAHKLPGGMLASDSPVNLGHLSVSHPANSFLINVSYRSANPVEAAAVANAVAHSYIMRGMEMRVHSSMEESTFMEKQLGELKKNMEDSGAALAVYEKQLGIINPDEKTSIMTARLLQLNTEYTEAQNDRIRKQADYQAFKSGSLAAIQVSPQASALAQMEQAMHTAQEKMATAKTIYGPNYSEYRKAANELNEVTRQYLAMQNDIGKRIEVEYTEATSRENLLHTSLIESKAEADALNANSMQYQELKREAEANKTLYTELYRKVKEAGINGAFMGSSIRIADEARPQLHPAFPNKAIFLGLGFLLSLTGSIIVVVLGDLVNRTLRDPDQVRRATGVDVLGILPRVEKPDKLDVLTPFATLGIDENGNFAIAKRNWFSSTGFYMDAIHGLLSTILVTHRGTPLRTILVTSAAPGEGKTSCIVHLAAAHARLGHRTLLIDADLRRPSIHQYFRLKDDMGLADAISDHKPLSAIRQPAPDFDKLDIVTAGKPNAGSFIQIGRKVEELLLEARKDYDVVFIDAPPMLCFTEPVLLACIADGVLVVGHAGRTNIEQVSGVVATLNRLRARTLGIVLNQVEDDMSATYKQYDSYYRAPRAALKSA